MVWCSVLSFKRTLWDHCRVQRRTKKQMDTKRNKERRGWWGELCPFHSSETEALIKRSHLTEKAKKAGCNKTNTPHGDKKKLYPLGMPSAYYYPKHEGVEKIHILTCILVKDLFFRLEANTDTLFLYRCTRKTGIGKSQTIHAAMHDGKTTSLYVKACKRKKYWHFWLAILISKLSVCNNSFKFE